MPRGKRYIDADPYKDIPMDNQTIEGLRAQRDALLKDLKMAYGPFQDPQEVMWLHERAEKLIARIEALPQ